MSQHRLSWHDKLVIVIALLGSGGCGLSGKALNGRSEGHGFKTLPSALYLYKITINSEATFRRVNIVN